MHKGTPGPWRHAGHGHIWAQDTTSQHEGSVVRVAIVGAFHDAELLPQCRERWMADVDLIVRAPELEAEVERLRAERDDLRLKVEGLEAALKTERDAGYSLLQRALERKPLFSSE